MSGWQPVSAALAEPSACERAGCGGTQATGHEPYCSARCARLVAEPATPEEARRERVCHVCEAVYTTSARGGWAVRYCSGRCMRAAQQRTRAAGAALGRGRDGHGAQGEAAPAAQPAAPAPVDAPQRSRERDRERTCPVCQARFTPTSRSGWQSRYCSAACMRAKPSSMRGGPGDETGDHQALASPAPATSPAAPAEASTPEQAGLAPWAAASVTPARLRRLARDVAELAALLARSPAWETLDLELRGQVLSEAAWGGEVG